MMIASALLIGAVSLSSCDDADAAVGDVFEDGDFTYKVLAEPSGASNGRVKLGTGSSSSSAYNGSGGDVVIPSVATRGESTYDVTEIADYAFGNKPVTSISIPGTVTDIAGMWMYYCTSASSFSVDPGNPRYSSDGGVIFNKAGTTLVSCPRGMTGEYTVSEDVRSLGNRAFLNCEGITSIILQEGLESIGDSAFSGCGITSMVMPDSVTSVEPYTFWYCYDLESVTISGNLTYLPEYMLYGCTSITSVAIPDSIETIPGNAFYNCDSLEEIIVGEGNSSFKTEDGVLFSMDGAVLVKVPNAMAGGYAVPEGVTTIGSFSFYSSKNLTSVTIPENVTVIGEYAFTGSPKLESVDIRGNVAVIDQYVFSGCSRLVSVALPDGLTEIRSKAFRSCTALTEMAIPGTVTTIASDAFSGVCNATDPQAGATVGHIYSATFQFSEGHDSCVVVLTCGANYSHIITAEAVVDIDAEAGIATASYVHGTRLYEESEPIGGDDPGAGEEPGDDPGVDPGAGDDPGTNDGGSDDDSGGNIVLFAGIGGVAAILAVAGVVFFLRRN